MRKTYFTKTALVLLLACGLLFAQKPGSRTPAPPNKESSAMIEAGDKFLDEGNWVEAIDAYQRATRVDPQNANAYVGLGDAYMGAGKWTEALVALKKAVALAPQNADAQYALGDAYNTMRMHGDAFAPLVKATQLDPTFAEAYNGIGYAYLGGQQYGKSVSFLNSAVRLKPDYEEAHYGLAVAYLNLGNQKGLDDERKKLVGLNSVLVKNLDREVDKFNSAASATLAPAGAPQPPPTTPLIAEKGKEITPSAVDASRASEVKQQTTPQSRDTSGVSEVAKQNSPPPVAESQTSKVKQQSTPQPRETSQASEVAKQKPTQPVDASRTSEVKQQTTPQPLDSSQASEVAKQNSPPPAEVLRTSQVKQQPTPVPPATPRTSQLTKQSTPSPAPPGKQEAAAPNNQVSNRPAAGEPIRDLEQNQDAPRVAEHRIALVIGNGAYTTAPLLKNPPNDARDMAATLRAVGFEVKSGINVKQREMKRLIREFGLSLKSGGAGLFYYAGHGVQSKGHNYLIPVDADIQSEADVEDSGVDVSLVLNYMDDAQNGLNIVILDACRNNPFGRSFRSANDGLAQVDAPTGTLIAYATAPGRVASDGTGQNGLYTSELLTQMRVSGLNATEMFMRVRAGVMKQTANKQVPWEASSLVGAFYFTNPPASAVNPGAITARVNEPKVDPAAFELSYWESVKNSADPEEFKSYLEKYPNGHFSVLAKNKLRQLETTLNKTEAEKTGQANAANEAGESLARPNPATTNFQKSDDKFAGAKSFDVRNGVKRTNGVLELSKAGLRFREVGGRNDFIIPCSAILVVTINTSWGSTTFHKMHLKFSFNGQDKQVDLDGKNNKQMRDEIMATCGIEKK